MSVNIISFYRFYAIDLASLPAIRRTLLKDGMRFGIRGSVIIAEEGMNGTISGSATATEAFATTLKSLGAWEDDLIKTTTSHEHPFAKLRVAIKNEIVTSRFGRAERNPSAFRACISPTPCTPRGDSGESTADFRPDGQTECFSTPLAHPTENPCISTNQYFTMRATLPTKRCENSSLGASDWHKALTDGQFQGRPVTVFDVRNRYETAIGRFKGSISANTRNFTEFPGRLHDTSLSKDGAILMCCTGGIRCEKAILAMKEAGFSHVYQLRGGILKYLAEFPDQLFEGECFVFDDRVALDQQLRPTSRYAFCPHCGEPAEREVTCVVCRKAAKLCDVCLAEATCSLDCRGRLARVAQRR